MEILFVEDDTMIASGVIYALETEGFIVTHCDTAKKALDIINCQNFSFVILDLSLPDGNGFDICKKIKEKKDTPVIFLTAADDEGNTVKGLEMGADDYITKPFRIRELIARVKSVLRRTDSMHSSEKKQEHLKLGDIEIIASQGKAYKNGVEIVLTALEYKLLLVFATNKGQILSRNQLLESLWDNAGNYVNDNTLTVYIKRLREKLGDDASEPRIIQTVRGMGYRAK